MHTVGSSASRHGDQPLPNGDRLQIVFQSLHEHTVAGRRSGPLVDDVAEVLCCVCYFHSLQRPPPLTRAQTCCVDLQPGVYLTSPDCHYRGFVTTHAAERRWRLWRAAGRSDGMASPAPLPMLPPDVMGCIARATLAAEGGDVRAWVRLSLVCRTWREGLQGALSGATLQISTTLEAKLRPLKNCSQDV